MVDFKHDVFVSSALESDTVTFSLWSLQTGTLLKNYKGVQGCYCLTPAGTDHVLTTQENKQVISVWDWRKEQSQKRIVCPDKVTAICCSPDGNYCVVGLQEKIFVWQMATGNLMKVLSKHYQNVTSLKFTDYGGFFVSAGDDNLVMVWSLSSVLSVGTNSRGMVEDVKPVHTFSHHSLPIKDLYLTCGGIHGRLVTCSLDQTCKVYDLSSGQQICSFLFDTGLSAVTMDPAETLIVVGGINGKIHVINISRMKMQKDQNVMNDEDERRFFGHSKEISALSTNSKGDTLLSGSADHTVRMWHIESGQCIKQIYLKGKVTTLKVLQLPDGILNQTSSKNLSPISNFKRNLFQPSLDSFDTDDVIPVVLKDIDKSFKIPSHSEKFNEDTENDQEDSLVMRVIHEKIKSREKEGESNMGNSKKVENTSKDDLVERVKQLEDLARTLYGFSTDRILNEKTKEQSM
eukprot:gene4628-20903_t